jgi:D-amino-acid dehydrogenase
VEPALISGLAGGYHIVQERHVRPDTLVRGLRDWLTAAGVEIRDGVSVTGFEQQGRQITGLRTTAGPIATESVVVAAGVWTEALLREVDVRVPITMGKGYSLDFEPEPPMPDPVRHAMYLHEERVALTPMHGRLRLAGTMELSGLNHRINPRRVEAISRAASEFLRGWPKNAKPATVWTGGRPLTPDGLPVIGMAPGFTNLAIASGHSMLGVTLATVTGEAIAEVLTTGIAPPDIEPFRASRFRWL